MSPPDRQVPEPNSWEALDAELDRQTEVARLGFQFVEIPAPYKKALGRERVTALTRRIEDRLMTWVDAPPSPKEQSAMATQFGAAARALDLDTSRRVVSLEVQEARLASSLQRFPRDPDVLQERLQETRQELEALSALPEHPDRWMEEHGEAFIDSRAARYLIREKRIAREQIAQGLVAAEVAVEQGNEGMAMD